MIDIDNSNLFFKIFRNKFLRNQIFKHLRKFNICPRLVKYNSIKRFKECKFKGYLSNVYYNFKGFEYLPNSVKFLKLGDNFWTSNLFILELNKLKNFLPQSLTHLELSNSFSRYSKLNGRSFIPESVTKLNIGDGFNRIIRSDDIPLTLKSLKIGKTFKNSLNLIDCKNLENLEFVEESHFNNIFNNDSNNLPQNLKYLKFGNLYTMEIKNVELNLPKTLTYLSFGSGFNSPINLQSLINLKSLTFESNYKCKFSVGSLPSSLTYLSINGYEKDFEIGVLPSNLQTLIIKSYTITTKQKFEIGVLPSSITNFTFNNHYNTLHPFQSGVLPSSLTSLDLSYYEHPIDNLILPSSLTYLELPNKEESNKSCILLKLFSNLINLKSLVWNCKDKIPPNILPKSLSQFKIINIKYYHKFELDTFPSSLLSLLINSHNCHGFEDGILPQSLKKLELVSHLFKTQFQLNSIPKNLEILSLSYTSYHYGFKKNELPTTLKHLSLPEYYSHFIDCDLPNLESLYIGKRSVDTKLRNIASEIEDISFINLFE
ncbi:hypothetical protein DDB_G0286737 [Dictyostelium discoideum AX4]|uniref:FNIP repeat-containing protein n=1 Tax=Dictyostelium discoideum TaxID=44689 RepID=Q54LB1_DICDI|nr:hypothetical protein DDB_G0286737 [Dictyostelium discoideum AX4]EAL64124.1 hypothetical protein DDB_G0286737 [Dictyostelium discoideum AX4]|eukprot:XP_637650.1 hypothetical protein DDB_G0286737 [Dictyostelium discoideum AX4]